MKHIFLTLLLAGAAATTAMAQALPPIPNGDFESFDTIGTQGVNQPNNWSTLVLLSQTTGVYTGTQGTTGAPQGSSFLNLAVQTIQGQNIFAAAQVISTNGTATRQGFPFAARPAYFQLQAKSQSANISSPNQRAEAWVDLTRWNTTTNKRDTICRYRGVFSQNANWGLYSAPLNYTQAGNPDTARIIFFSGISANDYVSVDAVKFSNTNAGTTLGVKEATAENFVVYPNPTATGKFTVSFAKPATQQENVQLFDLTGKVLATGTVNVGNREITLSTAGLSTGIYVVRVGNATTRLVVE